jgi:hypothetical protein
MPQDMVFLPGNPGISPRKYDTQPWGQEGDEQGPFAYALMGAVGACNQRFVTLWTEDRLLYQQLQQYIQGMGWNVLTWRESSGVRYHEGDPRRGCPCAAEHRFPQVNGRVGGGCGLEDAVKSLDSNRDTVLLMKWNDEVSADALRGLPDDIQWRNRMSAQRNHVMILAKWDAKMPARLLEESLQLVPPLPTESERRSLVKAVSREHRGSLDGTISGIVASTKGLNLASIERVCTFLAQRREAGEQASQATVHEACRAVREGTPPPPPAPNRRRNGGDRRDWD